MLKKCQNFVQDTKTGRIVLSILLAIILFASVGISCYAHAESKHQEYSKDSMPDTGVFTFGRMDCTVGQAGDVKNFDNHDKIGINVLFGCNDRSFLYRGETPKNNAEPYKDKPKENELWIYDAKRVWGDKPTDVNSKLDWSKDSTIDIHGYPLSTGDGNPLDFLWTKMGSVGFAFASGINWIFSWARDNIIWLSNFDINYIMKLMHWEQISDMINKSVLFNNTGGISPLLVIAVGAFIAGLAILGFRRVVKGTAPLQAIIKEFVILLVAAALCAFALGGGHAELTNQLAKLSTKLISAITNTTDGTMELFTFQSNDSKWAVQDATATEEGICAKVYIDLLIDNQFGVPANELDIYKDGGDASTKNWGLSTDEAKSIISKLTTNGDDGHGAKGDTLFDISTHPDGSLTAANNPNLGYFFFCACSNAQVNHPVDDAGDGQYKTRAGDSKACYYIVDFLSAVDAHFVEKGGTGSLKAQGILHQFKNPVRDAGKMFMCAIISLIMCFALWTAALYALAGKILFNLGAIFVPILPILLLIPGGEGGRGTRATAKKMTITWLVAALKMIVGQVVIVLIISISAILCDNTSILGMLLDALFLILAARGSGKLFEIINQATDQLGGYRMDGLNSMALSPNRWNPFKRRDSESAADRYKDKFAGKDAKAIGDGNLEGKGDGEGKLSNLLPMNKKQRAIMDKAAQAKEAVANRSNYETLKANGITDKNKLEAARQMDLKEARMNKRRAKGDKIRGLGASIANSTAARLLCKTNIGNAAIDKICGGFDKAAGAFDKPGIKGTIKDLAAGAHTLGKVNNTALAGEIAGMKADEMAAIDAKALETVSDMQNNDILNVHYQGAYDAGEQVTNEHIGDISQRFDNIDGTLAEHGDAIDRNANEVEQVENWIGKNFG